MRENDNDDDHCNNEDLLTNEEIQLLKANEKIRQVKKHNKVVVDSLVDSHVYSKKTSTLHQPPRSLVSTHTMIPERVHQYDSSTREYHDEEEDEDLLKNLNEEDVKVIIEDVIKKKQNSL